MAQAASQNLHLKVSLHGIRPPIWRRLLVPSTCTLAQLHAAIQAAFGWKDCHLHTFTIYGEDYGPRDPEGEVDVKSERITLAKLGLRLKEKFRYVYDFGDDWVHDITVEKVYVPATPLSVPVCLGGKRAGPPEDCGGIWGYENLLGALRDPGHPEHQQMKQWLGGDWFPEVVDLDEVDARLDASFPPARARSTRPAPKSATPPKG